MIVLNLHDVVQWEATDGPRQGVVGAVGETWVVVDGYWFTGDARALLSKV